MNEDADLLSRYATQGSEAAFAELVRRHVDLVYSAALRMLNGDEQQAEDVSQQVFIELSRRAGELVKHPALAGWLYTTARFMARHATRSEQRRKAREQEATTMNEFLRETGNDIDWARLRPVLDDAMDELEETDRIAVVLRFFQDKSLKDIGEALDLTENAARMRVSRALDKLQAVLKQRGIATGVTALSTVITANAVQAAPAGLALSITTATAALASAATQTSTVITATKAIAMTTFQKTLIATALVAGLTTLVVQHQSQANLRQENQSLRNQLAQLQTDAGSFSSRLARAGGLAAPKLPAPAFSANPTPAANGAEEAAVTNLYARLTNDPPPRLTLTQLEPYLAAHRRNAASLLAAYRCSHDPAFLTEAMQRFPNNPQVAFEAAFRKDATPQDKQQWLEALKKSDPGNALPNYLLASDYYKAGHADLAVQELMAASGKGQFRDYTLNRMQDDEEAYLAAGFSAPEAKTIPASQTLLPQLKELKEAGVSTVELAKAYRQAGDEASAHAALMMAANLGQRYQNTPGETEISYLVGLAIENIALKSMDPSSVYGSNGQTVQDRLNDISRQKATMKELTAQYEAILPRMSDVDWMLYKDRWRVFGEENALRWVVEKYTEK